jgi:anti-sigma factor RsiW
MIIRMLKKRRFMREHEWTHEHLSDYLDGELRDRERARVEEHVGMCPQCRRVLATLRKTLKGLGSLMSPPAPPGLSDSIIGRLNEP